MRIDDKGDIHPSQPSTNKALLIVITSYPAPFKVPGIVAMICPEVPSSGVMHKNEPVLAANKW